MCKSRGELAREHNKLFLGIFSYLKKENYARKREDVSNGKEGFWEESWIIGRPVFSSGQIVAVALRFSQNESNHSKANRGQKESEHDEVEPVPPLAHVGLEPLLPYLLHFAPNESF